MAAPSLASLIVVTLLCCNAMAEGGGEESSKKGEAAANEHYSGKQDSDWEAIQQKLSAAKGKIDAQASVVQALIMDKDHLKGEELALKIEEIKKQHQKYLEMVSDYNKQNDDFLNRYPERGIKEKRVYKRVKMKSLDAFEDDVSVRGKMNKLHKKILKQYPRAVQAGEGKEKEKTAPTQSPSNGAADVTAPIEIKK